MAKRNRAITTATIDNRLKEGRGQGWGINYKPWLTIQDVSSTGTCSRIKGWKTQRTHHLLSQQETNYFYILDWSLKVADINEQFPLLPLSETLEIASEIGIRHPTDRASNTPIVMTTDFYIAIYQNMGVAYQARTVKRSAELDNKRTIEKFEIERQYWQRRNISWGIVTEKDIPSVVVKNISWLHDRFLPESIPLSEQMLKEAKKLLIQRLSQADSPLTAIATDCDQQLGLKPGESLSLVRHLLATRQLQIDMNQPINPRKRLLLATSSEQSHQSGVSP